MHIGFVIPYFYPALQYGGQPRSCYDLARALIRRGHSVTVVTTDSAGSQRLEGPGRRSVEGIDVFYYPNLSNYLAFRHRMFLPLGLFRNLKSHLDGCDIVHIHELRSTLTVAASKAAQGLRVPYALSPHGGLRHLGKAAAKRIFDALYGHSILERASLVVAVSPLEVKEAIALNVDRSRIRIVQNAVFPEDHEALPQHGSFKAKHSIKAAKLVLFLGRLHWIKGADLLLTAFADLSKDASEVHLVIAGPNDGQEPDLLEMTKKLRIQDRTTFTGYLDHKSKLEALVDADVLVIPSRNEIFAITALEGLMCGTPVLLSSACGLSPMPTSDMGLHQFQAEDPEDLKRQLTQLLSATKQEQTSQRAKDFVSAEFSPVAIAERAESAYREAIGAYTEKLFHQPVFRR